MGSPALAQATASRPSSRLWKGPRSTRAMQRCAETLRAWAEAYRAFQADDDVRALMDE